MQLETEITMVETQETLEQLLSELLTASYASLDVESTSNIHWYQDGFLLLVVAISVREGHSYVIPVEHAHSEPSRSGAHALRWLFERLGDEGPKWVMQSGSFDWLATAAKGINMPLAWWDTQVAEYLITGDPQSKQSLVAIAKKYLDVDPWKDIDYSAPEEEDLQILSRLCGRDADITRRLFLPLGVALKMSQQMHLFRELLMPATYVLTEMTQRGLPVDMQRLRELEEFTCARLEEILWQLEADCERYGPWPVNKNRKAKVFNPGSFKQVGKVLYDILELPVPGFTDAGSRSTDAESLRKIEHMHPLVADIQAYRTTKKFHSSSLLPWLDKAAHGKLHPRYKPTQTRTGRLSSEDPNIQQVPPEGKSIFGGVDEYWVVEIDYSQLELRIVAELAGEETMLHAFHTGLDLHQVTADLLEVDRHKGKTANFGLLYGGGPRVLQREAKKAGIDLSLMDAEYIRTRWFEEYSDIAEYHEQVMWQAHEDRAVYSLIGRRRALPDLSSGDWKKRGGAERQAINMPVQSLASDITLFQLKRSSRWAIATVHDSIVYLIPDSYLGEVPAMQRGLEDLTEFNRVFGVDIQVPLKTDVKIARYWG